MVYCTSFETCVSYQTFCQVEVFSYKTSTKKLLPEIFFRITAVSLFFVINGFKFIYINQYKRNFSSLRRKKGSKICSTYLVICNGFLGSFPGFTYETDM